jgi:hypothetical protein
LTTLKVTPSEDVTDTAPIYPAVVEELIPSAWHHVERHANNPIEGRGMASIPWQHPATAYRWRIALTGWGRRSGRAGAVRIEPADDAMFGERDACRRRVKTDPLRTGEY